MLLPVIIIILSINQLSSDPLYKVCEKEKCSSVNNIKVLGSIGCDSNEFYVEFILNDIKYKGLLTEDGTIKIQKIKKDCLSSKVTIDLKDVKYMSLLKNIFFNFFNDINDLIFIVLIVFILFIFFIFMVRDRILIRIRKFFKKEEILPTTEPINFESKSIDSAKEFGHAINNNRTVIPSAPIYPEIFPIVEPLNEFTRVRYHCKCKGECKNNNCGCKKRNLVCDFQCHAGLSLCQNITPSY